MTKTHDMAMAIDAFEDEIKGIESYTAMIEQTTCPQLKEVFSHALIAERKHAGLLLNWINAAAAEVIG